jgi:hypothetical protein
MSYKSGVRRPPKIINFPNTPTKTRLIDVLTHFAYLTVVHNTLDGGDPVTVSPFLPYHLASLHAPLTTIKKGFTDFMLWLLNISTSVREIAHLPNSTVQFLRARFS